MQEQCQEHNIEFRDVPKLETFKSSGGTLKLRIRNYKSNLTSLEQAVLDEMKEIKDTMKNSYLFASERAAAKLNDTHRHWQPAESINRPRGHEARKSKGEKKMGLLAGDKLQM